MCSGGERYQSSIRGRCSTTTCESISKAARESPIRSRRYEIACGTGYWLQISKTDSSENESSLAWMNLKRSPPHNSSINNTDPHTTRRWRHKRHTRAKTQRHRQNDRQSEKKNEQIQNPQNKEVRTRGSNSPAINSRVQTTWLELAHEVYVPFVQGC